MALTAQSGIHIILPPELSSKEVSVVEVGIYRSRDPRFWEWKDALRRQGVKASQLDERRLEGVALKVFGNIIRRAGS